MINRAISGQNKELHGMDKVMWVIMEELIMPEIARGLFKAILTNWSDDPDEWPCIMEQLEAERTILKVRQ